MPRARPVLGCGGGLLSVTEGGRPMRIAKIVVAAAVYAIDKPYDYLVPEAL